MRDKWSDYANSYGRPVRHALVDTEALRGIPHLVWSGNGRERIMQLVGDRPPDSKNALLLSEKEAIDLYLDIIRRLRRNVKVAYSVPAEPNVDSKADAGLQPWQVVDKYSRQYPDDPRFTKEEREARAKNIADAMAMAGDFHDSIQVPTKKEFAGVPGKDYDATGWVSGFRPHARADRMDELKGVAATASKSTSGEPWVTVNDRLGFKPGGGYMGIDELFPLAVHESSHLSSNDMLPGSGGSVTGVPAEGSGRSQRERGILDAAYKFDKDFWGFMAGGDAKGVNKANAEQGGTNSQYRASLYQELSKALGRKPTYDEFKDFIRNMSGADVRDRYKRYANGYVKLPMTSDDKTRDKALEMMDKGIPEKEIEDRLWKDYDPIGDDKARIEAIRRAWLEVAKARSYRHRPGEVV